MSVPQIYFDNYLLRDISIEDAKDMFEYGKDLEVVKFLSWGPYETVADARFSIKEYFLKRPERGLPVGYAIVDLSNHKMIGTIDFHTLHDKKVAEIGYVLNKEYWNKGIMTKALRKVVEVGFYTLDYDRIVIGHLIDNQASEKVIVKNGFVFDKYGEVYDRFTGGNKKIKSYILDKENFK